MRDPGTRRLDAAAWLLLLIGHLVAWRGDAGFEHLGELAETLDQAGRPLWTGGSVAYLWPFAAARTLGVPWWALGVVHAALGAATLAVWQRQAPAWVGPRVAAWAGLAWAAWPVPYEHLVENSTLLAFYAPLVFVAAGGGAASGRRLLGVAAATALAVSASLLMLPTVAAAAAVGFGRRGWRGLEAAGAMALGAIAALIPLVLAGDDSTGSLGLALRGAEAASWLGTGRWLAPAAIVGLVGAAALTVAGPTPGEPAPDAPRLGRRAAAWTALAWAAAGLLPALALGRSDGIEPFHLAAAAPGVMLAFGLTVAAAPRRLGAAAAVLLAAGWWGHGGPDFRGVVVGTRCEASDAGACGLREVRQVLQDLDAAGLDPLRPEPLSFAGAYSLCLSDVRSWLRLPSGPELGDRLLLLPAAHPASGGIPAGGLRAWPGAQEAEPAEGPVALAVAGPAVLFVEGGGPSDHAERRCAETHPRAAASLRQGRSIWVPGPATVRFDQPPDRAFVTRLPASDPPR